MGHYRALILAGAFASLSLIGCDGASPVADDRIEAFESQLASCVPDENAELARPGLDGHFLRVAELQPGFAGLINRGSQSEVSVATGYPTDEQAYRTAIAEVLGAHALQNPDGSERPLTFREVDFTWPELVQGLNAYSPCIYEASGTYDVGLTIDVDENVNRVVVGTEPTAVDVLRDFLPSDRFIVQEFVDMDFPG